MHFVFFPEIHKLLIYFLVHGADSLMRNKTSSLIDRAGQLKNNKTKVSMNT